MQVQPRDTLDDLREAVREAKQSDRRDRVRMVLHAREGETAPEIAARLGCRAGVVWKWVRRYNKDGLDGLATLPRSGRPRKLPAEREDELRARLNAPPRPEYGVCALRGEDIQRILAEELGARYSLSGTYVVLGRMGYRPLMPRPRHPKTEHPRAGGVPKKRSGRWCG
jgi:transposase